MIYSINAYIKKDINGRCHFVSQDSGNENMAETRGDLGVRMHWPVIGWILRIFGMAVKVKSLRDNKIVWRRDVC